MEISQAISNYCKGVERVMHVPLFRSVHCSSSPLSEDIEPCTINGIFEFLIKRLFM